MTGAMKLSELSLGELLQLRGYLTERLITTRKVTVKGVVVDWRETNHSVNNIIKLIDLEMQRRIETIEP